MQRPAEIRVESTFGIFAGIVMLFHGPACRNGIDSDRGWYCHRSLYPHKSLSSMRFAIVIAVSSRRTSSSRLIVSCRLEVKRKIVDITEVAKRSGIAASTLRFYEEKGLITSIGRRGLRRVFDPGVLERLALVTLGRAAFGAIEPATKSMRGCSR